MERSATMDRIDVSPEMVSSVGRGCISDAPWPSKAVAFIYNFCANDGAVTSFEYVSRPKRAELNETQGSTRLLLVVAGDACERIVGGPLSMTDGQPYHLPANLRAIALAIRDCALPEAASTPYRLAKSIELLCETLHLSGKDELVPVAGEGISRVDGQRLLAARRMIDEQWSQKLTLDMIARACGLNRAKLTRGFRDMFDCSVADAIATQRLGEAGQMLVATDLPVSSIGYRCGYLNNASFTRAFARHFGLAPTQYRAERLAA